MKYPSAATFAEDGMHDEVAITKELFLLVIQDRKVQQLMDDLDLPPDRANLFEMLDADGSGTLQTTELLQGLLKIRGEVNKSDTVASLLATKAVQNLVSDVKDQNSQLLEALRRSSSQLAGLQKELKAMGRDDRDGGRKPRDPSLDRSRAPCPSPGSGISSKLLNVQVPGRPGSQTASFELPSLDAAFLPIRSSMEVCKRAMELASVDFVQLTTGAAKLERKAEAVAGSMASLLEGRPSEQVKAQVSEWQALCKDLLLDMEQVGDSVKVDGLPKGIADKVWMQKQAEIRGASRKKQEEAVEEKPKEKTSKKSAKQNAVTAKKQELKIEKEMQDQALRKKQIMLGIEMLWSQLPENEVAADAVSSHGSSMVSSPAGPASPAGAGPSRAARPTLQTQKSKNQLNTVSPLERILQHHRADIAAGHERRNSLIKQIEELQQKLEELSPEAQEVLKKAEQGIAERKAAQAANRALSPSGSAPTSPGAKSKPAERRVTQSRDSILQVGANGAEEDDGVLSDDSDPDEAPEPMRLDPWMLAFPTDSPELGKKKWEFCKANRIKPHRLHDASRHKKYIFALRRMMKQCKRTLALKQKLLMKFLSGDALQKFKVQMQKSPQELEAEVDHEGRKLKERDAMIAKLLTFWHRRMQQLEDEKEAERETFRFKVKALLEDIQSLAKVLEDAALTKKRRRRVDADDLLTLRQQKAAAAAAEAMRPRMSRAGEGSSDIARFQAMMSQRSAARRASAEQEELSFLGIAGRGAGKAANTTARNVRKQLAQHRKSFEENAEKADQQPGPKVDAQEGDVGASSEGFVLMRRRKNSLKEPPVQTLSSLPMLAGLQKVEGARHRSSVAGTRMFGRPSSRMRGTAKRKSSVARKDSIFENPAAMSRRLTDDSARSAALAQVLQMAQASDAASADDEASKVMQAASERIRRKSEEEALLKTQLAGVLGQQAVAPKPLQAPTDLPGSVSFHGHAFGRRASQRPGTRKHEDGESKRRKDSETPTPFVLGLLGGIDNKSVAYCKVCHGGSSVDEDTDSLKYDILVFCIGSFFFVPPTPGFVLPDKKDPSGRMTQLLALKEASCTRLLKILKHSSLPQRNPSTACLEVVSWAWSLEASKAVYDVEMESHVVEMAPYQLNEEAEKAFRISSFGVHVHSGAKIQEMKKHVAVVLRSVDEAASRWIQACALWTLGLDQAEALVKNLVDGAGSASCEKSDLSTTPKLLGVDVAPFGSDESFRFKRKFDGKDPAVPWPKDYPKLLQICKKGYEVANDGGDGTGIAEHDVICSCLDVTNHQGSCTPVGEVPKVKGVISELFNIFCLKEIKTFEKTIEKVAVGGNTSELDKTPTIDVLANIQKTGTYSVIPRCAGGDITPSELIATDTENLAEPLQMAALGCLRECAEAQDKGAGCIATNTFTIFIFAAMAEPSVATHSSWLPRSMRSSLTTAWASAKDLEGLMRRTVEAYKCEWKEVVCEGELQKKFQQFVNTNETQDTEQLQYVNMRKQRHPATYDLRLTRHQGCSCFVQEPVPFQARASDLSRLGGCAITVADPAYKTVYDLKRMWHHQCSTCGRWQGGVKLPALEEYARKAVEEAGAKAAKVMGKSKPFDANGTHAEVWSVYASYWQDSLGFANLPGAALGGSGGPSADVGLMPRAKSSNDKEVRLGMKEWLSFLEFTALSRERGGTGVHRNEVSEEEMRADLFLKATYLHLGAFRQHYLHPSLKGQRPSLSDAIMGENGEVLFRSLISQIVDLPSEMLRRAVRHFINTERARCLFIVKNSLIHQARLELEASQRTISILESDPDEVERQMKEGGPLFPALKKAKESSATAKDTKPSPSPSEPSSDSSSDEEPEKPAGGISPSTQAQAVHRASIRGKLRRAGVHSFMAFAEGLHQLNRRPTRDHAMPGASDEMEAPMLQIRLSDSLELAHVSFYRAYPKD
ncbi:nasB [Symbiodinium sp. CCMP2456]|nr:nasB [Symbiodinium sp. CCMP2456]